MKILKLGICFAIATTAIFSGCGKKKSDSSEGSSGKINLSMKTSGAPSTTFNFAPDVVGTFKNTSIASGRPDSLKLYIVKMTLEGSQGTKTIFEDTAGKSISVGSKTIDISNLFTEYSCLNSAGSPVAGVTECPCGLDSSNAAISKNADGSCPDSGNGATASVSVSDGNYTKLNVEFQVRAKVKGCVTGDFTTVGSPPQQGVKTYCTQASGHTFKSEPGLAAATDFPSSGAEEMDYQISKASELYTDATKTFTMQFPIQGGVTVTSGGTAPSLTMMLDTNRMLRFFNVNINQAPNPGMSSTRAYFFSTVFEESSFVFVGRPGDIRGFSWVIDSCANNSTGVECTTSTQSVAGWMTVIKDSDGKPIIVGIMPDDDNSLTVLKGSNKNSNGLDSGAFTASGSNYDIMFSLGTEGSGTIKNVSLDGALSSTQTVAANSTIQSTVRGGQTTFIRKL